MTTEPVDRARVERLARRLLMELRPVLAAGAPSRDKVYVALNALAFVLLPVLAGTDCDREALEFFRRALRDNLREFLREHGISGTLPAWLAADG